LADGVYIVVQSPDDSVHEVGLNVPPTFPSLHDTVPVAIFVEFEVSDTMAENVIEPPEDTVEGLGVRVRDVESSVLTTKVELVEVGTLEVLDALALDDDELLAVDVDVLPLEVLDAAALDEDELLAVEVYGDHMDEDPGSVVS